MGELAQGDQEDDEARHPRNHFVHVHDLVAEEGDEERACRNDNDTSISWYAWVDGVDELCTHDHIDGRPSQTGEAVENGN